MDKETWSKITYIENEIRSAGYDPYAQLSWFIQTNDARYITRQGNARQLVLELDMGALTEYVMRMKLN